MRSDLFVVAFQCTEPVRRGQQGYLKQDIARLMVREHEVVDVTDTFAPSTIATANDLDKDCPEIIKKVIRSRFAEVAFLHLVV